ncbi:hypothetical protein EXIGLDRAFT_720808 [Exidia glandulosa HHB12029]|uniref:F-box domain-containing protein n=1 Tax=Exidia glandulosa HHB12029 TaxID=1314781 RepID=A0A165G4W4_EXIGL|nr:hypothetical protein EXIGLDRAFT_720808 [Exidia glandulosa HHB12029]
MSRWWGDLDAHNLAIHQFDAYDEIGILRSGNIMLLMHVSPLLDDMIAGTAANFTSLTRFTISECHWPDTGFPSAPNLRELSIVLYTCSWWSRNFQGGDVSGILLSSASWDCPSLSALSIIAPPPPESCPLQYLRHANSSCACCNGCIISLESVCAFVRVLRGSRYNTPLLRSLTLSGIQAQADVDPVTALLRVQDIADEIIFCGTPPRDLEMLERLASTLSETNHTATQLFDTSVRPLSRDTIDYLNFLR